MIKEVDISELEEVTKYAYRLNSDVKHMCWSCPKDYDKLLKNYTRTIERPNDKLLAYIEEDTLKGVVALLVEPDNKYMQTIGGIFAENNFSEISNNFFRYIEDNYSEYSFYSSYSQENVEAAKFMKNIGAETIARDLVLKLNKSNLKNKELNKDIVIITDKYVDQFSNLHSKLFPGVYWDSDRLLNDNGRFNKFIAVKDDKVIGEIVINTFNKEENEIYFLGLDENVDELIMRDIIITGVSESFKKSERIIVFVDYDDTLQLNAYLGLGFEVSDTSVTFKINKL